MERGKKFIKLGLLLYMHLVDLFMLKQFLRKNKFFRRIVYGAGNNRAIDIVDKIQDFLDKNGSILDIGSGTCNVCEVLSRKGYKVTPLDIQNLSFIDNVEPVIYDGKTIPFNEDKFDTSLILCVLHHTLDPERILREAKRVSRNIIVIEDIYDSWFQKCITLFFDSLFTLEFIGHPHSNKNDKHWRETFAKLGLKIIDVKYGRSFLVFKHATYYLEK